MSVIGPPVRCHQRTRRAARAPRMRQSAARWPAPRRRWRRRPARRAASCPSPCRPRCLPLSEGPIAVLDHAHVWDTKTRHCGRRLQLVMDRMAALANRAAGQPCHGRADDCGDGLDGHRSLLAADRAGRFPCAGNRAKETGPSERIGRDARRGDRTDMISRSPNRLESVPTKWPRMRCATSRDGTRIRCSAPCSE